MKTMIIAASQRHPSQSRKVADFVEKMILDEQFFDRTDLLDLGEHPLPLWDQGVWGNRPEWESVLKPLRKRVREADAFVMVIPEWNGAATPAIKNFSLFFDEKDTGHKPVLLVSISSEVNGQYPVVDMMSFGRKNNKWIFIPDYVIIRFVHHYLNGGQSTGEQEAFLHDRLRYGLEELRRYASVLRRFRESWTFDERFKYAP
ncbi:MAG: NAD(P)H-dependent oxidoreductase [Chlorobi bacterium]|nr:NAD(P)H-dependent oxidoreductase [Chlorobiota bacterium]